MKTLVAFCLIVTAAIASDYVVYVQSTGDIVSYDKQYDIDRRRMTPDKHGFYGPITGTNILGILITTNAPAGLTNIVQLSDKTILDPAEYIYSIRITTEWVDFTNAIKATSECLTQYEALKVDYTNKVAAVTDVKCKAAFNSAKALIQQCQEEIRLVHNEVRELRKVIGRNIVLNEP